MQNNLKHKTITLKQIVITLTICLFFKTGSAQENTIQPVTKTELNTIIDSIDVIVKRYHIFPEVAKKIVDRIRSKNKKKYYSNITNPQILADSLKSDLRAIDGDLHMNMVYKKPREIATDNKPAIQVNDTGLWTNYGLSEIKVLEGNIGYLKIKHFTRHKYLEAIKPLVTSAIESLKNTDALIVDVRNNGGGFEDMVAYYVSYFFDSETPIHLSDYRCMLHDHTYGISTDPNVLGTKLPDTKLYVLINANTGSAAESFAYILKHLGRATIIGETTAGAGNGASIHAVNDRFSVQVSSEETINPITKTSFEKVGVIPNIQTTSEHAFPKGYRLALEYAKEHNTQNIHPSNYDQLITFVTAPETTINTENYSQYVGVYKGGNTQITITVENNTLYGQVRQKGGKLKLTAMGDHTFKVSDIKERVQFVFNQNNQVIKLMGIDTPMELNKIED